MTCVGKVRQFAQGSEFSLLLLCKNGSFEETARKGEFCAAFNSTNTTRCAHREKQQMVQNTPNPLPLSATGSAAEQESYLKSQQRAEWL